MIINELLLVKLSTSWFKKKMIIKNKSLIITYGNTMTINKFYNK